VFLKDGPINVVDSRLSIIGSHMPWWASSTRLYTAIFSVENCRTIVSSMFPSDGSVMISLVERQSKYWLDVLYILESENTATIKQFGRLPLNIEDKVVSLSLIRKPH
jgi:hypothetical protein